ncbi:leucine zipper domain-containing protein [Cryptosporangium phraense]
MSRHRAEGDAGLHDRSSRPHSSPTRTHHKPKPARSRHGNQAALPA